MVQDYERSHPNLMIQSQGIDAIIDLFVHSVTFLDLYSPCLNEALKRTPIK